MLLSISIILLSGLLSGELCKKLKLPALFGMIIMGIITGPYVLNLIDISILSVSSQMRKIALIIILIRAGLKLSLDDLKKIGRPAILMCFLPATFEIVGMAIFAPTLLHISLMDALIMGAVVGAVSPAVIVPKMIKLIDEGYGADKSIPQMILAGASVDDVFVIVLFTTFTSLAQGGTVSVMRFVNIPVSIAVGTAVGISLGMGLCWLFNHIKMRGTIKVVLILSVSFIMTSFEDAFPQIPFASLIAVMAMGLGIKMKRPGLSKRLSARFDRLWVPSEIFLFVLVGASVAVDSLMGAGFKVVLLLFTVILFRMAGVFTCLFGTKMSGGEKLFCMLAYTPKATVQAAIGGLPLAMGLSCGNIVLTVSVVAILLSAPLGAFAIDLTYKKYLNKSEISE